MSFFRTAIPPPFQSYLFPTLPFRRRKASTDSTCSSNSTSSEEPYLPQHTTYLRCRRCSADLCRTSRIVSRGFTGRWGRAYLVSGGDTESTTTAASSGKSSTSLHTSTTPSLPNTTTHRPVARILVTGAHTVSDISCAVCNAVLGWKYVAAAEDMQRYKVGKFILETRRVSACTRWEDDGESGMERGCDDGLAGSVSGRDKTASLPPADVEFDSQDEEECEDLFLGVWTPQSAMRRRMTREFGGVV